MFSEQHEIYEKAKLIVSSKNIFFKIRLSFYIDHLEKMENLLSEYQLLNNTLNFNKFTTGIYKLRSENLSTIENNLFKKLKLIKYFRITYDNENHINNSKKLSEIFVEVEGQIREQDLKNVINNLINQYIKRGYTEEEISLMTFYRYPTKVKK